jgi:hypothetical protein
MYLFMFMANHGLSKTACIYEDILFTKFSRRSHKPRGHARETGAVLHGKGVGGD